MNSCPNCGEPLAGFQSIFNQVGFICPACLLLLRHRLTTEEQALIALYHASETKKEFKIDLEDQT